MSKVERELKPWRRAASVAGLGYMGHPKELADLLAEARERVQHLAANLPTAVDPLAVSDVAKDPYTALCIRESQAWRVEEFARAACDMFERDDIVVGISNIRHAAESCALVWYLKALMERAIDGKESLDEVHKKMLSLVVGFKSHDDPAFPKAINVKTMLEKADAEVPGVLRAYDNLSEVAHPNWSGSAGIYSRLDERTLITYFGKNLRGRDSQVRSGLLALRATLEMFEHAYNRIGDLTPAFVEFCVRDIGSKSAS